MSSYARFLIPLLLLMAGSASAADSPRFRGPAGDGVFPEEGLLQAWPESGPKKLWSASGLGDGFASVTVAGGRIYTTGEKDGKGYVHALDTQGKSLWMREYGKIHSGAGYPGTRTTPTYHEANVYLVSSLGKAAAFDAESGATLWDLDLAKELGARDIRWGITESPLIVDDKVIFTPGASNTTMVALHKKTGEKVWASAAVGDKSGYCSPRLFENGKLRQIVTLTAGHLIGVDPAEGTVLWQQKYPASYGIHAVSPVFHGNGIYVSDGYDQGGKMYELAADGKSVTLKWENEDLDIHHGGAVAWNGHVYGAANNGTWHALDAVSGESKASIRRLGKGAVVFADGRLYGYSEAGKVMLVNPDPAEFALVSELKVTEGEGQHWAHPVIAGGVLYVRHGDVLMAFDVKDPG